MVVEEWADLGSNQIVAKAEQFSSDELEELRAAHKKAFATPPANLLHMPIRSAPSAVETDHHAVFIPS